MTTEAKNNVVEVALGPVLYNWTPEIWRDFYFRIAEEAPIDRVYLGEVVCSKRAPHFAPYFSEVVARLEAGGKQVVLSTLALVMNAREAAMVRELAESDDWLIEANDVSALTQLRGRPHVVGPFVNVYNEATLNYLARGGASRVVVPAELAAPALSALVAADHAEIEVQVFGRLPLAISARCYHARVHGLAKDSCQYVCGRDPDGMRIETLDGEPFLAVNGVQTLSYAWCSLVRELWALREMGVRAVRLWPHSVDMVAVAGIFRGVLDNALAADEAAQNLAELVGDTPFFNGFYHGHEGVAWVGDDGQLNRSSSLRSSR